MKNMKNEIGGIMMETNYKDVYAKYEQNIRDITWLRYILYFGPIDRDLFDKVYDEVTSDVSFEGEITRLFGVFEDKEEEVYDAILIVVVGEIRRRIINMGVKR